MGLGKQGAKGDRGRDGLPGKAGAPGLGQQIKGNASYIGPPGPPGMKGQKVGES